MLEPGLVAGRDYRISILLAPIARQRGVRPTPFGLQPLLSGLSREHVDQVRTLHKGAALILFLVSSLLLSLLLFSAPQVWGSEVKEPKRVLILYSFDREQGMYVEIDESLRSTLTRGVPDRVEFYTEYLDLVRFPDQSHADNLVKLLRLRLAEKKPDLIVPVGFAALSFLLKDGSDLFPGAPIVALFNQRRAEDVHPGPERRFLLTAVEGKDEPERTLGLALQLQPDTQNVVAIVGDSHIEKLWRMRLPEELSGYNGKVAITYLTGMPMDAILKQVSGLPPHTIVLYTYLFQDARGQFFRSEDALDLIANASRAPVYGIYYSCIGHGVVGGYMADPRKTGKTMADLAVRVLNGEKPADIPMSVDSSGRDTVDWRQLKRWGISERRLPPGSVVLFKELSVWKRYRIYIIGFLCLLVLQAFLIFGLLAQRRHRNRAEKRLLSEKAFSDAVIESLPGVFLMQDRTHKNIRWNRNAEKIARYHPSQVQRLGNTVEKYRDLIQQKVRDAFDNGGVAQIEMELLGQGEATHYYHFSAHRVNLEGKDYVIGVGIDISERKRAEDELRLSEARFSSAFEYAPIGVALVAVDGRWIKVNRALCELLGYTADELQAMTFQDVTHPDDRQVNLDYTRQILADEIRSYQMEKRYIHKSGRIVWVSLSASLVRDGEGRPLYRISQIQDITERKRAEENLKQADERFGKAFRSSPEACAITTLSDKRFIEANDAFLRIMGFERSEVIGATVDELRIWPDLDERAGLIKKLLEGGQVKEEDVKFRTKSGKTLQIRMSAEIIQLQNEPCMLGLARDVTEQNLLEEQLRQAQKMEAVGRLAGGVAHDFNNLLGVIIGYSELVSSALPAESPMQKRVEAIKNAGQRAAALTTQLLAFSRKQTLQPRVLNLNSVVTETGKLMRPLLGEDIEQKVILDPTLGQVKADFGQIVQVIMNLAVNARDAMPSGGELILETANTVVDDGALAEGISIQPGSYVTLAVKDNGIGMDNETAARIFEPFYTTKPAGKGTGLGLATVYGIVEQSGGCIVVDTAPGEGTTFKIYFPRTDEAAKPLTVQPALPKLRPASGTVLLVEDELALRTVVDDCLRQEGYSVLLAANGMDALQVAERYKGPIHLLVTDVIMPFVSGPELARSLKRERPETRVLYMSGYTADKLAGHRKLDPDLALLQKPFKLVDLAQKVRDLMITRGIEGAFNAKGS
jgi:PAS domain S-box-containing protein